jgi:hypothetical protein
MLIIDVNRAKSVTPKANGKNQNMTPEEEVGLSSLRGLGEKDNIPFLHIIVRNGLLPLEICQDACSHDTNLSARGCYRMDAPTSAPPQHVEVQHQGPIRLASLAIGQKRISR